ncbi:BTB domain-containing protein [Mycena indigotica]|uniref:BTB domain-containing protein n=1 Tax=Mycena indigotica TaxID=2126181 RepID=A0A8H6SFP7_9AGAR|nr:BTB domain-containing protein [Mycena indigotica]KAF7298745.1 BTB domain-containing protein [Mycena indigotica]
MFHPPPTGSSSSHADTTPSETLLKRKRSDSQSTLAGSPGKFQVLEGDRETATSRYRDENYYLEDGSCIILVQDTLFNVHRTMLSKDNSLFSSMFSLPQGQHEAEGRSDDNPIVLMDDTVAEFRHFLWALYALPLELRVVHSESADLTQLMGIARIANKYSFKSIETWSLDAIQEYVNHKPSPIITSIPPPHTYVFSASSPEGNNAPRQLTQLIRLAQLCGHDKLLSTMVSLLRQLMSSSLQYAYLAMTLADELDLRVLRGAAYLEVMQKAVVVKRTKIDPIKRRPATMIAGPSVAQSTDDLDSATEEANEGDVDEEGRLVVTRAQQLRLLSGYYRLTKTWERLRITPPHFDHAPSCSATWHQHGCTQSWLEFWKDKTRGDAVLSLGLADVLGRLRQVQRDYDRWGSATYMHHDCRMAAKRSITEVLKRVEEALPDFFSEADD